jgi:hypothetical protein
MIALFVVPLLVGLLFGVHAMLHGVERGVGFDAFGRPTAAARKAYGIPAVGTFATVYGIVGAILYRRGVFGAGLAFVVAALIGVLAAVAFVLFVAKKVVPAAAHDVVDERYLLQGHLARARSRIDDAGTGEIEYWLDDAQHLAMASSVDGAAIPSGTDVVIERLENGVAYVEPWVQVEGRI